MMADSTVDKETPGVPVPTGPDNTAHLTTIRPDADGTIRDHGSKHDGAIDSSVAAGASAASTGDADCEAATSEVLSTFWSDPAGRWLGIVVAICVAAAALVVITALLAASLAKGHQATIRGDAAVQTATRVATVLASLDAQNLPQQINQMLEDATGPFRDQIGTTVPVVQAVFNHSKTRSVGKVTAAALEREDGSSATVLLTMDEIVTNIDAPQGKQTRYRWKFDLLRSGNRWLVADASVV
jgi:Mce-associated membrane protein